MPESTDLARRPAPQIADVAAMSDADLERMYRVAKALALSKRFPDAKTADEAFAKVLLGRDLGLSPTQAMTGLYIVEGKPQIAATTLAGFVRKSERYDYTITEHTDARCELLFWMDGDEVGRSSFSIDEAQRAGLVRPGSVWAKYPRNMLFARAMSNGVKWFAPDLMGGVPIYTEGDVFESTATEISSGHGDGSEPGWGATSASSAAAVEAIIGRAKHLGHAGLSDLATAQMSLSGQPDSVVAMWVERAGRELNEFQRQRDVAIDTATGEVLGVTQRRSGPAVEWQTEEARASAALDGETQSMAPDPEALREELGTILDRIAAEEEAGADEAVMAELYAEQERLERALGHDEPSEGQEAMPL